MGESVLMRLKIIAENGWFQDEKDNGLTITTAKFKVSTVGAYTPTAALNTTNAISQWLTKHRKMRMYVLLAFYCDTNVG